VIKINLATRKRAVAAANAQGKAKSASPISLDSIDLGRFKELPLRKVILPVIVGMGVYYMIGSFEQEELNKAQATLEKVTAQNTKMQAEVSKLKSYDVVKKSLEDDESTIRNKLETIKKLVDDRSLSLKVLLSVVDAIPKEVWLTEYKIDQTDITLTGASLGFSVVSDFMKNLHESAYFSSVDLVNSQESKEVNVPGTTNFELKAKRR